MKKNYLLNDTAPRIERCLLLLNATFLKGMHRIRSLSLILFSLTFLLVGLSANAQSPDINGGTSWTGWTSNGTALGTSPVIYGRTVGTNGLQDRNFSVYSTAFEFVTGQAIDSSPLGSPGFGAGWLAGDRIIGLGVADFINTTDGTETLLNAQGGDAIFKFDDKFFPASSVGGTNGFASAGSEFDLIVQLNGDNSVPLQPSNVNSQGRDQTIGSSSGMGSNGPFVSFYKSDGTSMQLFINLDYLARGGWSNNLGTAPAYNLAISTFDGPTYRVVLGFHGMEVVFDAATSATPPPPLAVRVYSDAAETDLVSSHATIQAAIDAATTLDGYVVRVDAGTYNEFVDVSKELSIRGANYGVDPNTGSRGDESIIGYNGDYAVEIFASNVTFDGFSVSNTLGNAVRISVGRQNPGDAANVSNVTVSNNIATGAAILSCPTCNGLYMGVLSFDNFEQAQYISSGIAFTNNRLTVSESNGRGITMSAYNGSQLTGDITISGNHILKSGSPTSIAGIELRSTSGFTSMQNVAISGNTISGFDIAGVFPRLAPTANISGNTFTGNVHDIRLDHDPANNNNVIGVNTFSGSTSAIWNNTTADIDISTTAAGSTFGGITLDASTSLADLFAIEDKIRHKVDLETRGFVRVKAGEVYVTPNSFFSTNTTPSIQRGVDAATAADILHVGAGSYAETVTVNKQLDIRGAGNSTIITNPGGTAITYAANGSGTDSDDRAYLKNVKISGSTKGILAADVVNYLTLDGVIIDGNSSYGIHVNNVSGIMKDWVITNSTFNANSDGFRMGMAANLDGLTINGTAFTDQVGSAIYIPQQSSSPGGFSNVIITDNTFTNNAANSNNNAALYIEKMNNAIISGNTLTNNGFNGLAPNARAIIVNLKFGSYSNIEITGNTIIENRNPVASLTKGYGLYFASGPGSPAGTLSGLTVTNNEIDGFWHAIELGAGIDRTNIQIKNNKINNVQIGVLAYSATSSSGTQITENSFTNLVGATPYAIATGDVAGTPIAATCNWFGSADLVSFEDLIVGDVNFVPFLINGTDNDPAIGFQPVPGACVPPCEISSVDASASSTPVPLGSDATLTATVSPAVAGVTVEFYLDGVSVGTAITNGDGIATLGPISGLSVHVYKVEAKVGTCASSVAYLPVFDPSASFVTGGGWITSPEGALTADPNVTGRANFGFVSRYKRGKNGFTSEVDGNTEFQFNAGNLNFESTMHESGSLVISGSRATYRGTGTINGQTGFKFMLVAIDGNWNGQSNPDRFRIKISTTSDVVIYDNELGKDENTEDATILGGGSIVIHEVKGKGKNNRVEDLGTMEEQLNALFENGETELESNKILVYPNPASETSNIKVSLSQDADVTILIFDAAGRLVMEERGYHETSFVRPLNLQGFSNGIYHVVVQINHQFLTKRLVKQ